MQKFKSLMSSLAILFILSSCAFSGNKPTNMSDAAKPLAAITVEAGEYDRIDTPVWFSTNDIEFDFENQPFVIVEVNETDEKEIAAQYEPGNPAKLWFCLSGRTEAGTKRTFKLYARHPRADWLVISAQKDDKTLTLKKGEYNILSYQYAVMPAPAGRSNIYDRSGFIYPLWSPAGNIVTEIHPADHVHHMGIWMPWTHTRYEGNLIDFWNVQDGTGTVRFSKIISSTTGSVFGGFQTEQEHVGLKTSEGEKVILNEIWDVRVYNVGGPITSLVPRSVEGVSPSIRGQDARDTTRSDLSPEYWIVDFKSTQKNITDKPLIQEEYRYGGFAYRGAREWKGQNMAYLTSEGDTQINANGKRSRWCDMSGAIDGKWEGVTIFSNPTNFQHPEPMRIMPDSDYVYFVYCPSVAGEWVMEPGVEHIFQYRLYVHQGKINIEKTERIWRNYTEPPIVKIETIQP